MTKLRDLLKAAYQAGYERYGAEMAGWDTESPDSNAPLGFTEWLERQEVGDDPE